MSPDPLPLLTETQSKQFDDLGNTLTSSATLDASKIDGELVKQYFARDYYLAQLNSGENPQDLVSHYLEIGWLSGLDPHPSFSTEYYLSRSPDVVEAKLNPYLHYLQWGKLEGRKPHPDAEAEPDDSDLALVRLNFDLEFYAKHAARATRCHVDLVRHYCAFGWRQGLDPQLPTPTRRR